MNCYCDCELCGDYDGCEIRKSENPDRTSIIQGMTIQEDVLKLRIENEKYKNEMDTAELAKNRVL